MSAATRSAPGNEAQLWASLQTHLTAIASNSGSFSSLCRSTNILQTALQNDAEPLEALKPKLDRQYDQLRREASEEETTLNGAIDNVAALISLKNIPEPVQPVQEKRPGKKRRLDGTSPAPESPLPMAGATSVPLSAASSGGHLSAVPPALNSSNRSVSPGPPTPSSSGRNKPARAANRESQLYDGRLVAFKTPPAKGRPAKDSDKKRAKEEAVEGGTWILARILKCVDREKARYEVQDVDEENGTAATYTTTPKSLIVLPDSKKQDTLPSSHHRAGSDVLAVYPDSTALYRARVRDPPTARNNFYSVVFEGDAGQVSQVAPHMLVEWPGGRD